MLDAWVDGVTAALAMEAYNSKWLSGDVIVVPNLPAIATTELYGQVPMKCSRKHGVLGGERKSAPASTTVVWLSA